MVAALKLDAKPGARSCCGARPQAIRPSRVLTWTLV